MFASSVPDLKYGHDLQKTNPLQRGHDLEGGLLCMVSASFSVNTVFCKTRKRLPFAILAGATPATRQKWLPNWSKTGLSAKTYNSNIFLIISARSVRIRADVSDNLPVSE